MEEKKILCCMYFSHHGSYYLVQIFRKITRKVNENVTDKPLMMADILEKLKLLSSGENRKLDGSLGIHILETWFYYFGDMVLFLKV
jgi:hypothetical protein